MVTSRTTALGEVAGDAAVLIDPTDARELGEAMVTMLENESLRSSLKAKGFDRVKRYTWDRAAAETLTLYREVCGGSRQGNKRAS